jgi:transcription termination/antitermination protein NusG
MSMSTIPLTNFAPLGALPLTIAEEKNWYAVYTRARHEKVVDACLRQKGITTFLPLVSQTRRWSDRQKVVQVSLFPSYTFVQLAPTAEVYLRVLQTVGVVGFVGSGHRGIPIPDQQIEDIQTVLRQKIPCAIFPFLRKGQRVRIRGGCLDGIEGLLTAFKGHKTLVISVESILQSLAIHVEGFDVEILSASDQN